MQPSSDSSPEDDQGNRFGEDRLDSGRIPTQAELDAADLAEIARRSRDADLSQRYPSRPIDPGPAPVALVRHARVAWWAAVAAGLICCGYGFGNLAVITDCVRNRLIEGITADPQNAAPVDQIDSLSSFFPPFMLVMILVLLAVEYPLLRATARHHSRTCRNVFLALIVAHLLCIVVGVDLLLNYAQLWHGIVLIGWLQGVLLLLAGLCTLRRSVNQWLPESTLLHPGTGAFGNYRN